MKKAFLFVKSELEKAGFVCLSAFCGDTVEEMKNAAVENGCCAAIGFESAEVASANASYRVKNRAISVFYMCSLERAGDGSHLDDIEKIFAALHSRRFENSTFQPVGFKLADRSAFLVYQLDFQL